MEITTIMVSNLKTQQQSHIDYSINTGDPVFFLVKHQNSKTVWLKIRRGKLHKLAVKNDAHTIIYSNKKYKIPTQHVRSVKRYNELLQITAEDHSMPLRQLKLEYA